MKVATTDIDRTIREALGAADAEVYDRLGEQALPALAFEVFRGRHRTFVLVSILVTLVLFVAGVYAAVRFLGADDLRVMMVWGGVAGLCFGAVAAVKIWYWIEMQRVALMREIKRVELQLAQLAHKQRGAP